MPIDLRGGIRPAGGLLYRGQAVLTIMVMIAYNLIMPIGRRAGLLRIEDVGQARWSRSSRQCCCGRGHHRLGYGVIGGAISTASQYLQAAVRRVTRDVSEETDPANWAGYDALAASRTVDDAVRHYPSKMGHFDLQSPVVSCQPPFDSGSWQR